MRILKFALGLSVSVLSFFLLTDSASAATLNLSPASSTVTAGQTFNVDIMLDTQGATVDGVDIYSLRYNPSILEVQDANANTSGVQITPGSLLPITLTNTVNATAGTIVFSQVTQGGTTYNGAGKLATISFKAIFNGTSAVTIDFTPGATSDSNVAGGGTDKLTSVTNASFTVTGGTVNPNPVPPPPPVVVPPPPPPVVNPPPPPPPAPTTFNDGLLIKDSNSPAVYVVEYGYKRPFASWEIFLGLGYKGSQIRVVNTSSLPIGAAITTANQRHVRGTLVNLSGTVYFLGALIKYPFPSAEVFYSWGASFADVVPGNMYDSQMETGPVVQMKQ